MAACKKSEEVQSPITGHMSTGPIMSQHSMSSCIICYAAKGLHRSSIGPGGRKSPFGLGK